MVNIPYSRIYQQVKKLTKTVEMDNLSDPSATVLVYRMILLLVMCLKSSLLHACTIFEERQCSKLHHKENIPII